ncbi:tetratricopeptide repeat protein [Streptomyces sedi]|uniref:Tetratricopeptide repeat protein n=1 Tax=Streptomyces sedi TaxID=555059 RepID=A0A5C4V485_9ACTN|nr:tetratricopeptide repeat protein [Streptomyces sedi]TNM30627.1 hypothetical protein FH715_11535 [Streptomyces sedi]
MSVNNLFGVRVLSIDRERCRVRLRVLVTRYEDLLDEDGDALLPDDPSFFFRVLVEAADDTIGFRYGPLTDLVTHGEYFDADWIDRHTHRFVTAVERVAAHNLEVDPEEFEEYSGECEDGAWPDEELLVQGDFDIRVTDPRWLEPLRVGDCWDTGNFASDAVPSTGEDIEPWYARQAERGSAHGHFLLGWLREERGDTAGAAERYAQAADLADPATEGKALLALGDLRAREGAYEAACASYERAEHSAPHPHYGDRYRSRAAVRRGVLLRGLGRETEADAEFGWALATEFAQRDEGLAAEIRRSTGTESPAAHAHRLAGDGDLTGARALLEEHYGEPARALAGPLLAENFPEAEALLLAITEDRDLDAAATLLVALSLAWADEWRRRRAVTATLRLAMLTGRPAEGYRAAVAGTGGPATLGARRVGRKLLELLEQDGSASAVLVMATAAECWDPSAAARGFLTVGTRSRERGDLAEAVEWLERAASADTADEETRALSSLGLGLALRDLGEPERAAEALRQAVDRCGAQHRLGRQAVAATGALAVLAHARGDRTEAFADWGRAVVRLSRWEGGSGTARALHTLLRVLKEHGAPEEAVHALNAALEAEGMSFARRVEASSKPHFQAVFRYGEFLHDGDESELGLTLLRTAAEGTGQWAARAALALATQAEREGDQDAAREWRRRAKNSGDSGMALTAVLQLGAAAKEERDLPALLEHFGRTAASDHEQAPLFAAHIGELCYWLGRRDEAVDWYRRTLAASEDAELVGEAGYRVGEILVERGEREAALPLLRRAERSGFEPFAGQARELLGR